MANKIGRYTVQSKLGRGSMAQVYLVHDPERNEAVALKALLPQYVQSPNIRRRFLREAAAIKRLDHEFIIPIYDFGEDGNQVYYTMKALRGGTLGRRIENSEITDEQILFIFERIAEAVDHIHKRGVIHRDIKPNNIIFNRFGHPFLADFGVIQLVKSRTTNIGNSFIGTPAYMSPEQVMSQNIDHRADLYALGIVLFEMLTSTVPYESDSAMGTAQMQVSAKIPTVRDRKLVDKRWQKLIEKALAKDPNSRYQSGAEMVDAIQGIVLANVAKQKKRKPTKQKIAVQPAAVSTSNQPVVKGGFNWLMLLPVLAALLLLGAAVIYFMNGAVEPPPTPNATVVVTTVAPPISTEIPIPDPVTQTSVVSQDEVVGSVLSAGCRSDDGYNFEIGRPEFIPPPRSDYADSDPLPSARYPITNHGCPLIADLIDLVALNDDTPVNAIRFEKDGQGVDRLDRGSSGTLVLQFEPETAQKIDDEWFLVVNGGRSPLELRFKSLVEMQVRDWVRLETDAQSNAQNEEIGRVDVVETVETEQPTGTNRSATNTPNVPTLNPPMTMTPLLSMIATEVERSPSAVPATPTDPPVLATATPNWNATKTHEAQIQKSAEDATQQVIDVTRTQQKRLDDATRTRQAEDAANNLTRDAYNAGATETVAVEQTQNAQQVAQNARNATATTYARATEWIVSQTRTRQAQIVKITQTYEARPTLTDTPRPTNTPDYNATATVRTQQTRNAQHATETAVARPGPTNTPEPRITEPEITNPSRCVVATNGFVETSFEWTGKLNANQWFAIRISSNSQNPKNIGKYVLNNVSNEDSVGGNGTAWSKKTFDSTITTPGRYKWTVALIENGQPIEFASQIGCFDNREGSG